MKQRLYVVCLMMVSSLFVLPSLSQASNSNNDCVVNPPFQCKFNKVFAQKTTDNLAQGSTNRYWSNALFNQAFAGKNTDALNEGSSHLYYTEARFDSSFSGKTSDHLSEGDANFYYTESRFDESFGNKTTDDLVEGSNNKYSQWSESNSDISYNNGYVGIGTPAPTEQLTVDGIILIRPAGNVSHKSPAIIAQSNDDFLYDDDYINHYAFGFHLFNGGLNAYVSSYAGVDIFTGGARRLRVNGDGSIDIANKVRIGNVSDQSQNPLELESGAHVTAGGVWTDASSIQFKQDVVKLELNQAKDALAALNPVLFRYKAAPEEQYAGFIAEEVPELVAMQGRKGLSPMDIVAVLTKVVQNQQIEIESLKARLDQLEQSKNSK